MSHIIPTLFISHGAPTMSLENDETTDFWSKLGREFISTGIKGVLMISAHWETPEVSLKVTSNPSPSLIYDFYGFPKQFYQVKYSITGSTDLANRVSSLLNYKGIQCELDSKRGIDHGAWVPAIHMFPEGTNIPLIQLSLSTRLDPLFHAKVGEALSNLRKEGILIIGSGGATHNLGELGIPSSWATEFEKKLDIALTKCAGKKRVQAVIDLFKDKQFVQAHPRSEHFMPLLVAIGASSPSDNSTDEPNRRMDGEKLHSKMVFGNLSLASYQFGDSIKSWR